MKAFFVLQLPEVSFVFKKAIIKDALSTKYFYRQFSLNDFSGYY